MTAEQSKEQGKVVLITGASRGIGAACARMVAEQGYCVVLNYRQQGDLAEVLAAELREGGAEARVMQADVTREDEVLRLFETIRVDYGRLDALVNNAGVLETQGPLVSMGADRLRRVFDTNILGSFHSSLPT